MLAIRLTRTGKTHAPHYRIVVQEKRSKLNGKAIDIVGHYHPAQSDKLVVIHKDKIEKWLNQGAQPSETVTNLLVKEGIFTADKKVSYQFTPKKQAKSEEAPQEETASDEATPAAEEATPESDSEEATSEAEEAPATETPLTEDTTSPSETSEEATEATSSEE